VALWLTQRFDYLTRVSGGGLRDPEARNLDRVSADVVRPADSAGLAALARRAYGQLRAQPGSSSQYLGGQALLTVQTQNAPVGLYSITAKGSAGSVSHTVAEQAVKATSRRR
jgi:hypothetical protein